LISPFCGLVDGLRGIVCKVGSPFTIDLGMLWEHAF
jgi:hypothetical protein